MKKIFLFAAVAASALLSSCDMDKFPEGAIEDTQAIVNPINARYFRNGLYNGFRSLVMGPLSNYSEVQMDNFQALAPTYGNNLGNIFKGDFTSATDDFAGAFSLFYGKIADLNYYLPYLEELIESEEWTSSEHMNMVRYRGEVHFFRAFYYFQLASYFCQDYDEAKKDVPALGVPLVTEYNPTTDRSSYKGRSTLGETYTFILEELKKAEQDILAYETQLNSTGEEYANLLCPAAAYVNSWAIRALKARIARAMNNDAEAVEIARDIIDNSGLYQLVEAEAYAKMWSEQPGNCPEIIMQAAITPEEAKALGQTNSIFYSYNGSTSWYVPSNSTINMYQSSDVRRQIWFTTEYIEMNGTYQPLTIFSKDIGMSIFANSSASRGCYIVYPFRIAEMYLIIAECSQDLDEQNNALRDLRMARGLTYRKYPTRERVIEQARIERNRELISEGFRMTDLRRYGKGFTRDAETPTPNFPVDNFNILYFVQGAMDLSYEPNDHRFIWPIPSTEIQVNPQIVGQQNPGY